MSRVLCDKRVQVRLKGSKLYRTVVGSAMLYVIETIALKRINVAMMEVGMMKMLWYHPKGPYLEQIRVRNIKGHKHSSKIQENTKVVWTC